MKKFLVPVDLNGETEREVNFARKLAADILADLHLLYVYYDPIMNSEMPTYGFKSEKDPTSKVLNAPEKAARQQLKNLAAEIQTLVPKDVQVTWEFVKGLPEEEIIFAANRNQCDLIIMATRAKSKVYKALFGSVTSAVMNKANLPVLVLPPECDYRGIKHVLYASDFDPEDTGSIRNTFLLLSPLNFDLCSIYVFNEHGHHFEPGDFDGLKEVLDEHIHENYPETRVTVDIIPDEDLLSGLDQAIQNHQSDLLVLTTHARTLFKKITDPSLSRKIMFHVQTPILIFHAPAKA